MARDGYGWTEFIDHTGCADRRGCARFFRRAGAWLALLHCFAGDRHASGEHDRGRRAPGADRSGNDPAAGAEEHKAEDAEGEAFDAAMEIVGNSVMMVGLLPAYGRSADNNVFAMGGMTADWNSRQRHQVEQHQFRRHAAGEGRRSRHDNPNLPHVGGRYAKFGDHIEDFVAGFEDYANFLLRFRRDATPGGFVRRLCRPSRSQGRAPDPLLLHAAAAAEKSSDHGRRRDMVGASRLHRQACGMGQGLRSALAVAARRTLRPARVECAALRVAERRP